MKQFEKTGYLADLQKRSKQRNVTQEFQLIGLEIAMALRDVKHKALYIKYAKEYGSDRVLAIAKDVASRRDVKNPGAYFMSVMKEYKAKNPK